MSKRALRALLVPAALLAVSPAARADQAADAFAAFSAAYLVQNGTDVYFSEDVASQKMLDTGGWGDATVIYLAEDVYEREPSDAHRTLVHNLVATFLKVSGTDWSGDGWNDDLAWMVTAVLRGYQITGDQSFYNVAKTTWDTAYDRGWDTTYGGGGVWELQWGGQGEPSAPTSKCCLSNNPLITTGLLFYQITGDATYLQKSQGMYDWVKAHLVKASGQVNGCWGFTDASDTVGHVLSGGNDDNAYDSGSFVEAAEYLYRLTGTKAYYDDTVNVVAHRTTTDAVLHSANEYDNQWAYHFLKGLSRFATFNGLWSQYEPWMTSNANAAWSKRNSLNITWNDWTAQTEEPILFTDGGTNGLTGLCTSSAAAIWQLLPQSANPALAGTFELQNVHSGLSLGLDGGGDASDGSAVVQAPFAADATSLWTFVPSAGAYYRIENVGTGQFLSVAGNSAKLGANVVASSAAPHAQGNDQWLPAVNADGSFTFYNLSSDLALDDPNASTVAGAQQGQWVGNGTPGQSFTLIPHVATGAEGGAPEGGGGAGVDSGGGTGESDASDAPLPPVQPDGSLAQVGAPTPADASGASEGTSGAGRSASNGCGCGVVGGSSITALSDTWALASLAVFVPFRRRRKDPGATSGLVAARWRKG